MNDPRDDAFIAEALPAFVSEAREQVEQIESLLLQLEDAPADREMLDALFRCAHTIKGSAGVFGLDAVVAFTHHVESLLDQLREGRLAMTPAIGTLLLQSNDQIGVLIAAAGAPGGNAGSPLDAQIREGLVERLRAAAHASGDDTTETPAQAEGHEHKGAHAGAPGTPDGGDAATAGWSVRVRFGPETFRNGSDPLAILDYLRELGELRELVCDSGAIPALDALDPECCHLAFRFRLDTAADQDRIAHAFDFVRADSDIEIEPSAASLPQGQLAQVATRTTMTEGATAAQAASPAADPSEPSRPMREAATATGDGQRFIRVQADRLDAVINLLGELVIAGAGAAMLARHSAQRPLIEANQRTARLIEQIRNGTLQLRMVPIGETFARFRRVVRDTAAALGKDVQLDVEGGETELDKAVVERIADPLMHVVRNALDHGLEPPQERLAAGKPAVGRLLLSACHESGSVVIRICDDGRGIQRDKVLRRARERGLLPAGAPVSDEDVLNLLFAPGFSTADAITDLSGRGVGMDVVRRNIEELRGTVTIASTAGGGSTIEIRLPLTLAIIDGFLVGVGASKFIFPLESVVEVIENRSGRTVRDARGRGCIEVRGRLLPVVQLRTLYGLDGTDPARGSVVVIRAGTGRYGVMVDALLGQHQTVIKPLGRMLRSLRGISGSSILGSGEVALILDVAALGQMLGQPAPLHNESHPVG